MVTAHGPHMPKGGVAKSGVCSGTIGDAKPARLEPIGKNAGEYLLRFAEDLGVRRAGEGAGEGAGVRGARGGIPEASNRKSV
jgi:hypothetical protein